MQKKQNSSHRLSSVIAIIICIVLIPLLVMNLTIIIKSYINPDEVPDFFGIKPFVVLSGSMEPAILAGDLVIIKTANPVGLKLDDIISYKEGDSIITHRIIDLQEQDGAPVFITKGDANNTGDLRPVTYSQVEGIYLFRIAKLGNLAMFMQTPMGLLTFVGIPLLGFILYDVLRRRQSDKKESVEMQEAQAEIERLKAELAQTTDDDAKQ